MGTCTKVLICGSVVGAILIILGAVLGFAVVPGIMNERLAEEIRLENGTEQFDRWKELSFTITYNVYMFNIENPDDVVLQGAKPKLTEVGPFVYRERRSKKNITRDSEADTLTYYDYHYFEYDAEATSPLSQYQNVTVINVPLNALFLTAEKTIGHNIWFDSVINQYWPRAFPDTKNSLHKIPVNKLLFDGYNFCKDGKDLCEIIKLMPSPAMEFLYDGSILFSFLKFKDNTHDGLYTISAGIKHIQDVGLIREWNESDKIQVWKENSTCDEVKGRDSTVYPPNIDKDTAFDIFNTDICRVATVEYAFDEIYKGITGQRRRVAKDTLTNSGDNKCYCSKESSDIYGEYKCFPDGFQDVYPCVGAPLIVSFPHFLWADEEYSSTVDGLSPDEEKHAIYVTLEPGTGFPLKAAKRAQLNMVMRPMPGYTITEKLPRAIVPLLWIEEIFELPDEYVQELKDRFLNMVVIKDALVWTTISVGIALFLGCGGYYLYKRHSK